MCSNAAFPLIIMKRFHQRSWTLDKDGPQTVPEADSDFEEITAAEKPMVCNAELILLLLTINDKRYTQATQKKHTNPNVFTIWKMKVLGSISVNKAAAFFHLYTSTYNI